MLILGAFGYSASAVFSGAAPRRIAPGRASPELVTSLVVVTTLDFFFTHGMTRLVWLGAAGASSLRSFSASLGLSAADLRPKSSDLRSLGGVVAIPWSDTLSTF